MANRLAAHLRDERTLAGVAQTIAIASGKGGVGKSTVAANLACALQATGVTVGLLDADIYGPSIPKLFGIERPTLATTATDQIIPWNHEGLKVMSMGFLVTDQTPVIWRGPMVHNILTQFIRQVAWGTLDYLLLDLPPGTGDAQLTITQTIPLTGAIIVTTPQEVAIQIASKGLQMFGEVNVPVLGLIENMSYLECPHCRQRTEPFRHGGTQRAAEHFDVPFLGEIPLDPTVTLDGDAGRPTVSAHPESVAAQAYRRLAETLIARTGVLRELPQFRQLGESHLQITWPDSHESRYAVRDLRLACACALCVDEQTGHRRPGAQTIPADVHPLQIRTTGQYALHISWSDGHKSGLYPFTQLRAACPCAICQTGRSGQQKSTVESFER